MRQAFNKLLVQRLLFAVVAGVLVSACSPKGIGRMVGAGTFNNELLIEGGIVIGGVSAEERLNLRKRLEYAQLLEQVFHEREPLLATVGPKDVLSELGRNLYTQMLDSYAFHETGSTAFMNELHQRFPKTRYVVFARIEGTEIEQRSEPMPDGRGYELHTILLVGVSMRVFDLNSRQLQVWAAGLRQADKRSRRVFGQYSEERLKSLYPEPPETKKVLQKTMTGLVEGLIPED